MHAPQVILIVIWAISLATHISRHGEYQLNRTTGAPHKYNAYNYMFSIGVIAGLLYWGGFFNAGT